jgi:hypothetical protein
MLQHCPGGDSEDNAKSRTLDISERKRDDDYYMVDGSCVLLVENTLFNVRLP